MTLANAPVCQDLLTRARNLERYPFESATMAEAGRLAAQHLREAASAAMPSVLVPDSVAALLGEIVRIADDYDLRAIIDEFDGDTKPDSFIWRDCIETASALAQVKAATKAIPKVEKWTHG